MTYNIQKRLNDEFGIEHLSTITDEEFMRVPEDSTNSGWGGWEWVNSLNLPNAMKDPEVVKRCIMAVMKTKNKDPEKYANIARENLKKAVEFNKGTPRSDETKRKISESNMGHIGWNKGQTLTKEHKDAIAESWDENRRAEKGKWLKERIRQNPNIVKTNLGKTFSNDTKTKMSKAAKDIWKNRDNPIVVCPHCNKEGKSSGMKAWHFDNCKQKDIL
jgi:hypothetical protein